MRTIAIGDTILYEKPGRIYEECACCYQNGLVKRSAKIAEIAAPAGNSGGAYRVEWTRKGWFKLHTYTEWVKFEDVIGVIGADNA